MKNPVRVIAGLRGAVAKAQQMVDANREDIANGHPFERHLHDNLKRLAQLRAKLTKAEEVK